MRRVNYLLAQCVMWMLSACASYASVADGADISQEVLTDAETEQLLASTKEAIACLAVQERGSQTPIFAGTGFFIHERGLLLTNYHVIFSAEQILAHSTDGVSTVPLQKVIYCDRMRDMCILQFAAEVPHPVVVRTESLPDTGEKVYAVGFVDGCENLLVSSGRFEGRGEVFKREMLLATTPIVVGNSGGLMLDGQGRAFGVLAGVLAYRQPPITFGVPIIDLLAVDLGQEVPLSELTVPLPLLAAQRGLIVLQQQDYAEAIRLFTDALAAGPDPDLYELRGLAFYRLERLDEALVDLNTALDLATDARQRSAVLTNRGIIYKDRGQVKQAMEDFDRAIELYSQNAAAFHDRGLLHDLNGDSAKAIADYSQAVTIN